MESLFASRLLKRTCARSIVVPMLRGVRTSPPARVRLRSGCQFAHGLQNGDSHASLSLYMNAFPALCFPQPPPCVVAEDTITFPPSFFPDPLDRLPEEVIRPTTTRSPLLPPAVAADLDAREPPAALAISI
ncbi:hypothetical protein B0H16DRAFT_1744805 [Mycena metata]|uniref:Uncharacterized protein n=1 Tax=Mycena metata TaxID=1033252 RepID=A0AAD7MDB4_9AGAR|nr:hypothetical protein B0H16DRAFT_1744805 [Mycena metata]